MPAQLGLFATREPRILVDDATGRIAYYPDVFSAPEAHELFAWALESAPWSNETMWMYDHMVDVPRLVARFHANEAPQILASAQVRIETLLGVHFTTVGLNYYRNGRDSVAWHNDHLEDMPQQPTIALVSLGATREMLVRSKRKPRITHAIDLEAGSVLEMSGRSQEFWEHTIPKSKRALDARISIAFRPRLLEGTHEGMDEKPHFERDVESDRPYEEDGSVPGDNDVTTALDPEKERKAQR